MPDYSRLRIADLAALLERSAGPELRPVLNEIARQDGVVPFPVYGNYRDEFSQALHDGTIFAAAANINAVVGQAGLTQLLIAAGSRYRAVPLLVSFTCAAANGVIITLHNAVHADAVTALGATCLRPAAADTRKSTFKSGTTAAAVAGGIIWRQGSLANTGVIWPPAGRQPFVELDDGWGLDVYCDTNNATIAVSIVWMEIQV